MHETAEWITTQERCGRSLRGNRVFKIWNNRMMSWTLTLVIYNPD